MSYYLHYLFPFSSDTYTHARIYTICYVLYLCRKIYHVIAIAPSLYLALRLALYLCLAVADDGALALPLTALLTLTYILRLGLPDLSLCVVFR